VQSAAHRQRAAHAANHRCNEKRLLYFFLAFVFSLWRRPMLLLLLLLGACVRVHKQRTADQTHHT
jgi:hypothetical protein